MVSLGGENVVRTAIIVYMMVEFIEMVRPLHSQVIGVSSVPVTVVMSGVKELEYVHSYHVELQRPLLEPVVLFVKVVNMREEIIAMVIP